MARTQSKNSDILKTTKTVALKKNSTNYVDMTNCHQNLDIWGNMLYAINIVTFFHENVAHIEVTCKNEEIYRTCQQQLKI